MDDMIHVNAKPMFDNWEFYFDPADSLEECLTAAKALVAFFAKRPSGKTKITGQCKVSGQIFGHNKFEDGTKIKTSYVESLEIIKRGDGSSDDLIRVDTIRGSAYYIVSGQIR